MSLWGNKDTKSGSGTLAIAANGLVTGSSSAFNTEAAIGNYIKVSAGSTANLNYVIVSITNSTSCQVQAGLNQGNGSVTATSAGNAYSFSEKPSYVAIADATGVNANQIFGVDTTEMGVSNGSIVEYIITSAGSGYASNSAVTLTVTNGGTGATANAEVNGTGRVITVHANQVGSGFLTSPTVAIGAPAAVSFNALTAVSNTNDTIAIATANSLYLAGDIVRYLVAAGNTAVTGLSNGAYYYIQSSNTSTVKLSATSSGAAIDLTAGVTETGHTLTGETATAVAVISGAANKGGFHSGWVRRIRGTGGRAGRIQYETLVATGSVSGDAEDTIFKDS